MRDYVVLNGVKSSSIRGLMVQEVPPVSKPRIRTQVEEIDGRDGDIITPLGYSAYDKELKIGLYGQFDVDDVISYFDSSGTVIFSNEPDKYYKYQIFEQIDFEKLIRFREAIVKFHVQPFKYSAVEEPLEVNVAEGTALTIPAFNKTENGITVKNANRGLSFTGHGVSGSTEFYVPISPLTLVPGDYALNVTSSGFGATSCPLRLIQSVPSNAQSFGGNYVTPVASGTTTINATLANTTTYNYLWFYVSAGVQLNATITATLLEHSMFVNNLGNTVAKPTITINGTGTVNLYLNGSQVFVIDLSTYGSVTIDTAAMEAYLGSVLMNRQVTGDYENFLLNVGGNTVSWTGDVTQVSIKNYSRWI